MKWGNMKCIMMLFSFLWHLHSEGLGCSFSVFCGTIRQEWISSLKMSQEMQNIYNSFTQELWFRGPSEPSCPCRPVWWKQTAVPSLFSLYIHALYVWGRLTHTSSRPLKNCFSFTSLLLLVVLLRLLIESPFGGCKVCRPLHPSPPPPPTRCLFTVTCLATY